MKDQPYYHAPPIMPLSTHFSSPLSTTSDYSPSPEETINLSLSPFPPTLEHLIFFDNPSPIRVSITSVREHGLMKKLIVGTAFGEK